MLLKEPQPGGAARLWIVIKNTTSAPHVLCRSFWGYTLIPADPESPGFSEADTSLHGCGDKDHDPFWLALPGESRFDSYEMKSPPEGNYKLQIRVKLVESPLDSKGSRIERRLAWDGALTDAISVGKALIARQLE
jgi:hypothetical protein